ncbi:hypothetical protein AB0949_15035 [Streptomyces albus]|nr:hypothetical protein [Streptomyces albus]
MPRKLRMIGTSSEDGKCPTLYEDVHTGDIVVQGPTMTDPEDIRQLANVLEGESSVVVPRDLLIRFAPKE